MSGGVSDSRICDKCGYVFMALETECPKCAHAPAAPPSARSTAVDEVKPRPKEPVTLSGFIAPNNRLASLKSIIHRDAGFIAILVLLAMEFLMASVDDSYAARTFAVNFRSSVEYVPQYTILVLFAAILAGVLSLRYWGYVIALLFAGLALLFDIRVWLWFLSIGLEYPRLGLGLMLYSVTWGALLSLVFHTGIHLFVVYGLVKRAGYYDLSQMLRKEQRKLQPVWIAGGMAAVLFFGWLLWSSYITRSKEQKAEAERSQHIQCTANVKQIYRAMLMFAQDHNETLPNADTWTTDILPYIEDAKILQCPCDTSGAKNSYAMNAALSGRTLGSIESPAMTVLLFESGRPGLVTSGGAADVATPPRHSNGNCYAFVDGHTMRYKETPNF